jgi:predicted nucleotidyltransferase
MIGIEVMQDVLTFISLSALLLTMEWKKAFFILRKIYGFQLLSKKTKQKMEELAYKHLMPRDLNQLLSTINNNDNQKASTASSTQRTAALYVCNNSVRKLMR